MFLSIEQIYREKSKGLKSKWTKNDYLVICSCVSNNNILFA